MLNLEICKKILNKGNSKYTPEQIKEIREKLYEFAHIELKIREDKLISYEE